MKFREKLDDCVTREIEEETGLDIEVTRLLWVRDFLDQASGHSIEFFFLATRIGGKFMSNVEASTCEFSFLPLEELSDAVFYPKVFIPKLKILRDNRNWAEENPYVRTAN